MQHTAKTKKHPPDNALSTGNTFKNVSKKEPVPTDVNANAGTPRSGTSITQPQVQNVPASYYPDGPGGNYQGL